MQQFRSLCFNSNGNRICLSVTPLQNNQILASQLAPVELTRSDREFLIQVVDNCNTKRSSANFQFRNAVNERIENINLVTDRAAFLASVNELDRFCSNFS